MSNEPKAPAADDRLLNKAAKKYVESCDNQSGSFLQHQLESMRAKAYKAGWRASEAKRLELTAGSSSAIDEKSLKQIILEAEARLTEVINLLDEPASTEGGET